MRAGQQTDLCEAPNNRMDTQDFGCRQNGVAPVRRVGAAVEHCVQTPECPTA